MKGKTVPAGQDTALEASLRVNPSEGPTATDRESTKLHAERRLTAKDSRSSYIAASTSTTKTRVSVPLMPAWDWPPEP